MRVGHGLRFGNLSTGEPLELGIEFAVFWRDQDVIELRVMSSNGYVAGWTTAYVGHDMLPQVAERLKGFPSSTSDSRDFGLGTFDPKYADGGLRMHFYCLDSVGHAAVEIKIRGDGCEALGEVESVALRIPIEAAGVDSFVAQVRAMDTDQLGATARLPMAGQREYLRKMLCTICNTPRLGFCRRDVTPKVASTATNGRLLWKSGSTFRT
jgi:hypothetical protein